MSAQPVDLTADGTRDFLDYPRPSLAVDPVVLEVVGKSLRVAVWKRETAPFKDRWALPGVFVNLGETLEGAVIRGIATKCRVPTVSYIEQLFTWDRPGRDPRGWVVAVAYFAVGPPGTLASADDDDRVMVGDIATDWMGEVGGPAFVLSDDGRRVRLAFDHEAILGMVVKRLRGRLRYSPIALEFLPATFTLRQLQNVYEAILSETLNKDSFRRHIVQTMEFVEPTGTMQDGVAHRPAELYRRSLASGTT